MFSNFRPSSAGGRRRSVGFCRGSRVEGKMSRVEGKMSRVKSKMSRVQSKMSRVQKCR